MSRRVIWEQAQRDDRVEDVLLRVAEELDSDILVSGKNGPVYECHADGMTGREMFEALKRKAEETAAPVETEGRALRSVAGGAAPTEGVIVYHGGSQSCWKWWSAVEKAARVPAGAAVISTSMCLFRSLFVFA